MDGSKCVLQLRGVRPFLSDKYDITRHKNYRFLSDSAPKNAFDIGKYVTRRLKVDPEEEYLMPECFVADEEMPDAALGDFSQSDAFNPAVELSYLSLTEQTAVAEAMAAHEVKPSLSQAVRLKKLKQDGKLTLDAIDRIISEDKKPPKGEPTGSARYRRFFPPSYSPKQIDEVITELLTDWKARAAV